MYMKYAPCFVKGSDLIHRAEYGAEKCLCGMTVRTFKVQRDGNDYWPEAFSAECDDIAEHLEATNEGSNNSNSR